MTSHLHHTILTIDDEPEILSSLNRLLRREYRVLAANSAAEGIELLKQHEVHIILTDQRMPEMEGMEFLDAIKGDYPDAIPMLLTGYADLDSVIAAINTGNIYRYLVKPWNPEELLAAIREACKKYDLLVQNRQLAQTLRAANIELEERVKERTAKLERTNDLIATLSQVGAQLQIVHDYHKVIDTLSAELREHNLYSLSLLCNAAENPEADSQRDDLPRGRYQDEQMEEECTFPLQEIPEFRSIIVQHKVRFISNMEAWSADVLNYFDDSVPSPLEGLAGVSARMKGAMLPLGIKNRLTGILVLWGEDIEESDLVSLSILASQVGIALENATLFEAVHRLAEIDGLTGIYNRRRIIEIAEHELARARRSQHHFSLIMMDVNQFKQINDTYGHGIGDLVLKGITKHCLDVLRKDVDVIGRYGGDEFVILLPETDAVIARKIAERLSNYIKEKPVETPDGSIQVSISLGIASISDQPIFLDELLNQADQAMYEAKKQGR